MTKMDQTRVGLRLLEFETGVSSNIDDSHSAELVDYEASRTAGQAGRMAMLVKGQDVIEDETKLKKVAALELGISGPEYSAVKRFLIDADLIEERTTRAGKQVLNEKVERLNHADNYRRIGEVWTSAPGKTEKEEALVHTLDRVIQAPTDPSVIDALTALRKTERDAVIELGSNAGVVDSLDGGLLYSPLLWDVHPKRLAEFTKVADKSAFSKLLEVVRMRAGTDFTSATDALVLQAIRGGVLPSYRVTSTGGERVYSFAPYTGALLSSDTEKTILDKARALVSCLRYGNEAATITRIRRPSLILKALMDSTRQHRVGPHSELKQQYGMLVSKQLGKVIQTPGNRYYFELIPTPDNLRACRIATELIAFGEIMGEKESTTDAAILLVSGNITHPLREVRVAKKKRAARADELNDLVERLRSVI
jgi:hypothetical protein